MKRSIWTVLLALLVISMIGACAPAATPAPKAEPTKEEAKVEPTKEEAKAEPTKEEAKAEPKAEGKVTIWHAYQTGSSEEKVLTKLIDNAKKQYPNLGIDVLQIPFDQIFNKWQTEVAAGEGPDMFVAPNDSLGDMARASLVLDLDKYLAGKLDMVAPVAVEGMKVDGVLYGVPESAKAVALYYNKDKVKEAPKTTDDLMKAIKGGTPTTFFVGAYHLFGWSGSFGGKLLDKSNACIADQGGWAEMLQYLVDLKAAGAKFQSDYGQAEAPFRSGETAFFANGPWALADYKKDLGDKLGVVALPKGTADATPFNGIDGFYINPNGKSIDQAVDLALFLTNKESSQIYTDEAGHVPVRSDVKASDPLVAAFAEASAKGFPRPQTTQFANYWTPFGDMFTKAIEGISKPADAVKDACTAMNTANKK